MASYQSLYEEKCRAYEELSAENAELRAEIAKLRAFTSIANAPPPQKHGVYCIWTANKTLKYAEQTNEGARRFSAHINTALGDLDTIKKEVKKTAEDNDEKEMEAPAKKKPRIA